MDAPWFYCPDLAADEPALPDVEARHALGSRRLRPGDPLTLFDGAGTIAEATLLPPAADGKGRKAGAVRVRIHARTRYPRPTRRLTLFTAACKGDRLDYLIEKCTELGVTEIVLTEFARSIVRPAAGAFDKLRRTALEACKQCRRPFTPEIAVADWNTALHRWSRPIEALRLIAHLTPDAAPLGDIAPRMAKNDVTLAAIGPEGGLSDDEVAALSAAGGQPVRLALNVLRVETAATALAAVWASAEPQSFATVV